jgi:hypothetical protein
LIRDRDAPGCPAALEEAERPALAELRSVLADDLAHRRGIE